MRKDKFIEFLKGIDELTDWVSCVTYPWVALWFVYSSFNPFTWPILGKGIFVFFIAFLSGMFKGKLFPPTDDVCTCGDDDDENDDDQPDIKPVSPFTKIKERLLN